MTDTESRAANLKRQGHTCLQNNQAESARQLLISASKLSPDDADIWHMLGSTHAILEDYEQAGICCRKALAIQPRHGGALYNLGVVLQKQGDIQNAIRSYRKALRYLPGHAVIHSSLGYALYESGLIEEAVISCEMALAINPNASEAWNNLSIAQWALGQHQDAIKSCNKAILLRPDYAEAYNNLGNYLSDLSRYDEAIDAYTNAIKLNPRFSQAHVGKGRTYNDTGQILEAIDEYQQAILLDPMNADAHFNLSWSLLLLGDFEKGWPEYEWRLRLKEKDRLREYSAPRWDGSPLNGRTLFLQAEQGFGDAIQFIRYVPLVKQQDSKVIVECAPELRTLFSDCKSIDRIIPSGETPPEFDCYLPLASLPLVFKTTLENLPASVPYLKSPGKCLPELISLLEKSGTCKRIGLVWSGNPDFKRNHLRACPLEFYRPLLDIPNTVFFSLQKGEAATDVESLGLAGSITQLADKLHTFSDTAAALNELDLIIATDTSVPHLAGALGRPVWVLLSSAPDWRWLLEREDSPWYPSMRLFRQPEPGDWGSVIAQVSRALSRI